MRIPTVATVTIQPTSDSQHAGPCPQRAAPCATGSSDTSRDVLTVELLLGLFAALLVDVWLNGPLSQLDGRVAAWMNRLDLSHPLIVRSALWATSFGSTAVLSSVVAAAAIYLWLIRRKWWQAVFVIATAAVGLISNNVIKLAVGRDRPTAVHAVAAASGKSFPSGHAMNSTVIYGALLMVAVWNIDAPRSRRVLGAGLAVLVGAIAISRVVLVVHYVTDVVAGVSLGVVIVITSGKALRWALTADARRHSQIDNSIDR